MIFEFFLILFILIISRYVVFKGFDGQKPKQTKRLEHCFLRYEQFKFADKGIIFLEIKDTCTKFLLILNSKSFSVILVRNYDKK